jgi:hypothetical protein
MTIPLNKPPKESIRGVKRSLVNMTVEDKDGRQEPLEYEQKDRQSHGKIQKKEEVVDND